MSTTRLPIDATRSTLHAAARRVFARQGVHAATMAEIAAEAHLSLDALHRYYATEDDLLRDIISEWVAQTPPETGQTPTSSSSATPPLPEDHATHISGAGGERHESITPSIASISVPVPVPTLPKQGQTVEENRTSGADMSQFSVLSSPPHTRGGGAPFTEIFSSAVRSLMANSTRSALTMLGIIIGVAAVISLLAIGNGVQGQITGQITSNGANLVTIQGSSASANGVQTGSRYQSITLEDAQALDANRALTDAVAISPELTRTGQATGGTGNAYVTVNGVWPTYLQVHNSSVQTGDFFTDADVSGDSNVIVLGPTLARQLFGADDPLGKNVSINGKSFRVLGVMTSKSAGFMSPDSQAFVPITTALSTLPGSDQPLNTIKKGRVIGSISITASSQDSVNNVVDEATDIMNQRHGAGTGPKADFEITTQSQLLQTVETVVLLIRIFLVAVAGISLLVGGIGIMNIMLVSVTERTREIGIRKAIGAKESTILAQFVTEAVLISLAGALIGVVFGLLISLIATALWRPCPVNTTSIAVAVLFAMATGLFFGVYPAQRAASLKPIDALRYE